MKIFDLNQGIAERGGGTQRLATMGGGAAWLTPPGVGGTTPELGRQRSFWTTNDQN